MNADIQQDVERSFYAQRVSTEASLLSVRILQFSLVCVLFSGIATYAAHYYNYTGPGAFKDVWLVFMGTLGVLIQKDTYEVPRPLLTTLLWTFYIGVVIALEWWFGSGYKVNFFVYGFEFLSYSFIFTVMLLVEVAMWCLIAFIYMRERFNMLGGNRNNTTIHKCEVDEFVITVIFVAVVYSTFFLAFAKHSILITGLCLIVATGFMKKYVQAYKNGHTLKKWHLQILYALFWVSAVLTAYPFHF